MVIWVMFINRIWVDTMRNYHVKHFKSEKAECKCLLHLFFSSELVETKDLEMAGFQVDSSMHTWTSSEGMPNRESSACIGVQCGWKSTFFYVYLLKSGDFFGGSAVKNLPVMPEMWVWSLGQEDPLEKEPATHSSILAWEISWTEEPGDYSSTWLSLWTWLNCVLLFSTP